MVEEVFTVEITLDEVLSLGKFGEGMSLEEILERIGPDKVQRVEGENPEEFLSG